ncbi:MAG: DUF1254 domain-containing protein [Bacteroidales bacterium]
MKFHVIISCSVILLTMWISGCTPSAPVTPDEAREIAREAYIYGFPMVVNYKTMYYYTLDKDSPEYKGPFNTISCEARLFTPEDKAVVTPNSDTPYCMFWCDIRQEPVVISVPGMEPDRFYHFQLIDLYTHNFAYLGTLTTGNGKGSYMIAGPEYKGGTPEGVDKMIPCETGLFFVVVRTQLMGDDDLENVKRIQAAYQLQTLSEFEGTAAIEPESMGMLPVWNEGDQFTAASLKYLDVMFRFAEPVPGEVEMRDRFARLGIGSVTGFALERFAVEVQKAIEEGVQEGRSEIGNFISDHSDDPLISAKIFGTRKFLQSSARENYGLEDFYLLRAAAAQAGLYGNSGAEALYPTYRTDASGTPLNAAEHTYTITFEPGAFPPVNSFWSLSMYDGATQLFIKNPLDRYLLNSNMTDRFIYEGDSSLTLYISKDSPGADLENNWLPAPDGPFYVVMRLYGPQESALDGTWKSPPLLKSGDPL